MKGIGNDEKKIIDVIEKRGVVKRMEIDEKLKKIYGKELVDEMKGEMGGKFEDDVVEMMK